MKKIAISIIAVMALGACGSSTGSTSDYDPAPLPEDNFGGTGMTYNGKLGIDMGGYVLPYDGSGMQPGFGF